MYGNSKRKTRWPRAAKRPAIAVMNGLSMGAPAPCASTTVTAAPSGPSTSRSGTASTARGPGQMPEKKSLPLSSTTMKAGNFSTSMRQTASMPSSGNSWTSTFLMEFSASLAAAPPTEPR